MLEFVNLTGAEAGKDQQTRRKVRSQAMRDFRRRQRAENDRRKPSSSTIPSTDPGEPSEPQQRVSSSNGWQKLANRTMARPGFHEAFMQSSELTMPTVVTTTNHWQKSALANTDWEALPGTAIEEPVYVGNMLGNDTTASLPIDHATIDSSSAMSQTSRLILDRSADRATSDRMLDFCRAYIHWLCPSIDAKAAAEVLTSRQQSSGSPTIFAALCLAAIGHLDTVKYAEIAMECALHKARAYGDIAERMQTSSTAFSDEIAGCLACLLSFEMSTGSKASVLHLHGLKSIIELKGGLHTFGDQMAMMLECLDLCHSLSFDAEPVFTVANDELLPAGSTTLNARYEAAHSVMNLIKLEAHDHGRARPRNDPYRRRIAFVSHLVDSIKEMLTFYELNGWNGNHVAPNLAHRWQQQLESARFQGLEADVEAADAHYLARIIYLRWLLVYNLSVHPWPPEHPSNQAVVDSMWNTLWKISEHTWSGLSYMRIWILISSVVNTSNQAKKSCYKAQLMRCVFKMGIIEWPRVKTFMLHCLTSRMLSPRPSSMQYALASPALPTPRQPSLQSPTPMRYQAADMAWFEHATQDSQQPSLPVHFLEPDRTASAPVPRPAGVMLESSVKDFTRSGFRSAATLYVRHDPYSTTSFENSLVGDFHSRMAHIERAENPLQLAQPEYWATQKHS